MCAYTFKTMSNKRTGDFDKVPKCEATFVGDRTLLACIIKIKINASSSIFCLFPVHPILYPLQCA